MESLRDLATALLFSSAILERHEQRLKRGFPGFLAAGEGIGISLSPRNECLVQLGMECLRQWYV